MVFGAVAPIPLRATNVEEALVGKPANEETAELAGAAGVDDDVVAFVELALQHLERQRIQNSW